MLVAGCNTQDGGAGEATGGASVSDAGSSGGDGTSTSGNDDSPGSSGGQLPPGPGVDPAQCPDACFVIEASTMVCPGESPAHVNFNVFWSAFDRHYAVFDRRLPDTTWRSVGESACDGLGGLSGDALFDRLLTSAEALDDGHVQLSAEDLGRYDDAEVSLYAYDDLVDELEGAVEDNYIDGLLTYAAQDEIAWGTIGDIGYISVTSLDELSADGYEDEDVAAANEAMGSALADLSDTAGIVIDVRANGGGWDAVSLAIATWFSGERTVAWTEQVRNGPAHDDLSPPQEVFVESARTEAYDGPVVVLTSGSTFSAAETFVLAMRVRDRVTQLGEATSGHLSDLVETCLPNGWSLTLSGERYVAADGVLYEGVGVPPDVPVDFDPSAFEQNRDTQLEAALTLLE